MRAIIQRTALTALLLAVAMPSYVLTEYPDAVWMRRELYPFKMLTLPARVSGSPAGLLSHEEWNLLHMEVFDEAKLNTPISVNAWAALVKLSIRLSCEQAEASLNQFVSDFKWRDHIHREDAVGSMTKLLSVQTIPAAGSQADVNLGDAILDVSEISDQQLSLISLAYREGLLDAWVKSRFRPKAYLTHAEAVSMAYRIMNKYGAPIGYDALWPSGHWSSAEVQTAFRQAHTIRMLQRFIPSSVWELPSLQRLDLPVSPELWHQLLVSIDGEAAADFTDEAARYYTTGLVKGGTIDRMTAVTGLLKLYAPAKNATSEEIASLHRTCLDAAETADDNKLAAAYAMGLVKGRTDNRFHPERPLSLAEAYVLAVRMSAYLNQLAE